MGANFRRCGGEDVEEVSGRILVRMEKLRAVSTSNRRRPLRVIMPKRCCFQGKDRCLHCRRIVRSFTRPAIGCVGVSQGKVRIHGGNIIGIRVIFRRNGGGVACCAAPCKAVRVKVTTAGLGLRRDSNNLSVGISCTLSVGRRRITSYCLTVGTRPGSYGGFAV